MTGITNLLGKSIEPNSLFIDEDKCFLGASPDGFIGFDGLLEIKCLFSVRNMTPDQAIKRNIPDNKIKM